MDGRKDRKLMKRFLLCMCILGLGAGHAPGQKVSGRSAAGSFTIAVPLDSTGTPSLLRMRAITYDYEFSEPSGNKSLDPRETGRLRVVLTNTGKVTAKSIVVRVIPLSAPVEVSFNDSITVGDIPVNATRYAIFYFTATEAVPSQILTFQIDIHDPLGTVADSRLFTFLTKERRGY
jgi:hypothetical protein